MTGYFKELKKILHKYSLTDHPECIYNVDKKGLSTDNRSPCIVVASDSVPHAVTSGKRVTVTVHGCENRVDHSFPPRGCALSHKKAKHIHKKAYSVSMQFL